MKSRDESLRERAEILSALAHPSRLLIVEMLQQGERNVSQITREVGSDMSTVSRHLTVLRNSGIIGSRRDGNRILYSLRTPCISGFFQCIHRVISQRDGTHR